MSVIAVASLLHLEHDIGYRMLMLSIVNDRIVFQVQISQSSSSLFHQ
jgi:hypothetical protein